MLTKSSILLEDGPVLAVDKPAGLLTLGGTHGVPTLERQVKAWLKERYHKPGNVYLGIPHRLDRPVSGVVVFARNSKAAARLAEQFRERQVRKVYWAILERAPDPPEGELVDWLVKVPDEARVEIVSATTPGAREARLRYRVSGSGVLTTNAELRMETTGSEASNSRPLRISPFETEGRTLVEIELLTGRMHQIRAQLGARGWPVVGDAQYGATTLLRNVPDLDPRDAPIALHARSLTILHPIRYEPLTIEAPVPPLWRELSIADD